MRAVKLAIDAPVVEKWTLELTGPAGGVFTAGAGADPIVPAGCGFAASLCAGLGVRHHRS